MGTVVPTQIPLDDNSTLKILLCSDTHLGYKEKDTERGKDTFETFEEVLAKAKERQVDFVIHGGDLFDNSKPSPSTWFETMRIMRQYCLGDDEINFELLSDASVNFPRSGVVNYEDPNFNIGIPIFAIHGNHDDRTGSTQIAALDIMAAANFVNYFGASGSVEEVTISPLLIQKGETRLAVYGLGYIRDERLFRLFARDKVRFLRPEREPESWFNIFVLHQNRVARGGLLKKNIITMNVVPSFINLVIWGHEHKSDINEPLHTYTDKEIYGIQTGSTIQTVLNHEESFDKYVGVLTLNRKSFHLDPIKLESTRKFIHRDISLRKESEINGFGTDPDSVEKFLYMYVEDCIREARESATNTKKPLIRVKVEYTGYPSCNPQLFGQRFLDRVANPESVINFYQRRRDNGTVHGTVEEGTNNLLFSDTESMESLMNLFLKTNEPPVLLPGQMFNDALNKFLNEDGNAINTFISDTINKARGYVLENINVGDGGQEEAEEATIREALRQHSDLISANFVPTFAPAAPAEQPANGVLSRSVTSRKKRPPKRKFEALKFEQRQEPLVKIKKGGADVPMLEENENERNGGPAEPDEVAMIIESSDEDVPYTVQGTLTTAGNRGRASTRGRAPPRTPPKRRNYSRRANK